MKIVLEAILGEGLVVGRGQPNRTLSRLWIQSRTSKGAGNDRKDVLAT
jgi:hypothetical protein